MLARPEWNEPERREPLARRSEQDSLQLFFICLCFVAALWMLVILPIVEVVHYQTTEHYLTRYSLHAR